MGHRLVSEQPKFIGFRYVFAAKLVVCISHYVTFCHDLHLKVGEFMVCVKELTRIISLHVLRTHRLAAHWDSALLAGKDGDCGFAARFLLVLFGEPLAP